MARVPKRTFNECKRVHAINLLADQRRVAELPLCCCPGRGWFHSAFYVFLRGDVQVEIEFLALLGVGFITAEESPPIHPCFSVTGFRMRPIARTTCSQRDVCAASCVFPSGVRG